MTTNTNQPMSPEEQRIAIAEACGAKWMRWGDPMSKKQRSMTSEQRRIRAKAKRLFPNADSIRHIHPHCYCIAVQYAWAVFVYPPQDREPQVARDGVTMIHNINQKVEVGQWASLAYVSQGTNGGQQIIEVYEK